MAFCWPEPVLFADAALICLEVVSIFPKLEPLNPESLNPYEFDLNLGS
jgi:hypothetical protein